MSVEEKTFRGRPEAWLAHLRRTEDWTRRLFSDADFLRRLAPYVESLGVDPERGLTACRKAAEALFGKDAFESALAGGKPFRARCERWLSPLEPLARPAPNETATALKTAAAILYLLARVVDPRRAPKRRERAAWLFDQSYDTAEDQEFLAFHRYFKTRDDVVYNCNDPRGAKFGLLQAAGKSPVAHRWRVPARRKTAELVRLGRLAWLCMNDERTPLAFKLEALKLFRDRLRLESLLDTIPCERFLRVRSDYEASHPLATALCEARRGKHVGFSSGSYYRTPVYDVIDYHEYGLLGRGFLDEIYWDAWPKTTRYAVLGPFAADLDAEPVPFDGRRPVIGVFPTSHDDRFLLQEPFFKEFLAAVVALAEDVGGSLLFKDKGHRLYDNLDAITTACKSRVPFEVSYADAWRGCRPRSAPQALKACDLAVVMSVSTMAWEALALGRKVVVFEHPLWKHPFEETAPEAVVRDARTLKIAARRLLALSDAQYESLTAPLIERWGKLGDGTLVGSFVQELEAPARR